MVEKRPEPWTSEQIGIVRKLARDHTVAELSELLRPYGINHSGKTIRAKGQKLGIRFLSTRGNMGKSGPPIA